MTDKAKKAALPGNHGQFGVNNASEEHKRLEEKPAPEPQESPENGTVAEK
jgi:hypothetical protein